MKYIKLFLLLFLCLLFSGCSLKTSGEVLINSTSDELHIISQELSKMPVECAGAKALSTRLDNAIVKLDVIQDVYDKDIKLRDEKIRRLQATMVVIIMIGIACIFLIGRI